MNVDFPEWHARFRRAVVVFIFFTLLLCAATRSSAAASSRHWIGDVSALWTVAANWSNNVAPVAGDNLFFPPPQLAGGVESNFNNFAAGTTFGSLNLSATATRGHVLAGSRIVLTNGISLTANQSSFGSSILLDLTLGADQTFLSTRTLSFGGTLDVNGHALTMAPSGTIFINGTVTNSINYGQITKTNSGSIVVNSSGRFSPTQLGILNGAVRVDGAATNNTHDVQIDVRSYHGTSTLGGTGALDIVFAYGNGVINPATVGGAGTMQIKYFNTYGSFCFPFCGVSGGIIQVDLNSANAYDQIVTYGYDLDHVGTLDPPGELELRLNYAAQVGDSFYIIKLLPGDPYNYQSFNLAHGGNFYGLPYDSMMDGTNGYTFGISYTNGVSLTTLRNTNSTFALWKGTVSGTNYADRRWSVPQNWAQNVLPGGNNDVRFTHFQSRVLSYIFSFPVFTPPPPQTNDLVAATVASLLFADTGYVLYGNGLSVSQGITNELGTNACFLDIAAAGSLNLSVDPNSSLQLGGAFNGSGTVRKEGGGELLYTGATANSFVGNFLVNAGTFRVDGSMSDGSFTVNGGALSGTGTVSTVTMNGGTLSPGTGPGVLHVQGDLVVNSGATFQVELNSAIAGGGYDQVQVNGAVNITGATLNLQVGFSANPGTAFLILVNDAGDSVTGTFNGLPEGKVFQASGQFFSITYHGGSGNDIVVTRVSVPPMFSGVLRLGPDAVQLQGNGGTNVNYTVQASTNLGTTNWINIGTAPANASGKFTFTDSNVLSYPQRFFRVVSP
jgi:hypothetical protein